MPKGVEEKEKSLDLCVEEEKRVGGRLSSVRVKRRVLNDLILSPDASR